MDEGMTPEQRAHVRCLDCGLPYELFALDVVLPRSQWLEIHPTEDGVLCARCIVERAAKVPGATVVHAVIEITPAAAAPPQTVHAQPADLDTCRRAGHGDFDLGQFYAALYTVSLGVRCVASGMVRRSDEAQLRELLDASGFPASFVQFAHGDSSQLLEWRVSRFAWGFDALKWIDEQAVPVPAWIQGLLFGYSPDRIQAYIDRESAPEAPAATQGAETPECQSCGECHSPASMCPPHEVRRGTGPWSRKPRAAEEGRPDA